MDINIDIDKEIGVVGDLLSQEQKAKGLLIHAFQKLQAEMNYLPEEALQALGRALNIPMSFVYSTASFYKQFYFNPRGKTIVKVCTGTACHVRGASEVLSELKDEFGVGEGETTEDLSMTLETVGCVGCCGLAPVATINEDVIGEIDDERINEIIRTVKEA